MKLKLFCFLAMTGLRRVALFSLWASLIGSINALSTQSTTPTSTVFTQLQQTSLVRASDGRAILLPTLWRSNTPFAIGDEVATVAFLRHFG
jgi:hypothetical protein